MTRAARTTSDVIVAVASGPGPAAIGVIRLSGHGSHDLALDLCRDLDSVPEARRLTLTWIQDPLEGSLLDRAMVVFFESRASYTGEESVEFHCHGGRLVIENVMQACVRLGARPALPGEFTRRAVAAGRLDLVQAEAVALLAESPTARAAEIALDALSGRPSQALNSVRDRLLDALAGIEAALDFAEEDGVHFDLTDTMSRLADLKATMDSWIQDGRAALPSVRGARIAIIGPPNAGKSTLFNRLLGRERAIVHPEPGTTRDVVSEQWRLSGVSCMLMDTAGLRVDPGGSVEAAGMTLAGKAARTADIRLLVVDGSADSGLPRERADLVVMNKSDLFGSTPCVHVPPEVPWIAVSARTGEGVGHLKEFLERKAGELAASDGHSSVVIAGERQLEAVSAASAHLSDAMEVIPGHGPLEIASSCLRRAVHSLGEVTGSTVTEEVLDRIFASFCVGK